jgi:CRISPR/Cas system-associated exonuclease Cas4 (RecB family)
VSAALVALGVLVLLIWLFLRRRVAVLPGEVVYRDGPDAETLLSHHHRLAGRPDYVTREKRGLVPVEVKSRALGERGRPYDSERAQLLAYCLLAEEQLGGPVSHGLLHYRDRSVRVAFGDRERQEITSLLAEMDATREAHRSHQQARRCQSCGFRDQCGEALA